MLAELFAAPAYAWAMALVPVVYGMEQAWAKRWLAKRRECFGARLAAQAEHHSPAAPGVLACACALLTLAAMQPQWGQTIDPQARRGSDVVVCLDVSRSMLAADQLPSRLQAAHADLRKLVESGVDDRFALIAFAGEARRLLPLTEDRHSFGQLVELAEPSAVRRGGTDLAAALSLAFEVLPEESVRTPVVVLLTDGEDLEGRAREVLAAVESPVAVHAVGYGTPEGSKIVVTLAGEEQFVKDAEGRDVVTSLDGRSLRDLAQVSGGSYREARGDVGLSDLRRVLQAGASVLEKEAGAPRRKPRFGWPLLGAFLLLAWAGRGGRA